MTDELGILQQVHKLIRGCFLKWKIRYFLENIFKLFGGPYLARGPDVAKAWSIDYNQSNSMTTSEPITIIFEIDYPKKRMLLIIFESWFYKLRMTLGEQSSRKHIF
jgi:hypothetical protein